MTKKSRKARPDRPGARMWSIVSGIALVVSLGLIANLVFSQSNRSDKSVQPISATQLAQSVGMQEDARVQLVASRFRCACGGCGELSLEECTCDMPRGAAEEKAFIQRELSKGLTIDQVIREVDREYGHRKSG